MTNFNVSGSVVTDPSQDYCTLAEIKTQIPDSGLSSSTSYDASITQLITRASRLIDDEVGYWPGFFYPSTATVTRYYDGNGGQELDIEPIITLSTVSVSEEGNYSSSDYTSWTENTDFYAWPYNSTSLIEPIRRLIIDHNGDKLNWTRYKKAVKVTGIFGYSLTPPDAIKQACIIQTIRWYMRAKQNYQDASASAELGQMLYVKSLDPDVKELLWSFMMDNAL